MKLGGGPHPVPGLPVEHPWSKGSDCVGVVNNKVPQLHATQSGPVADLI